MDASLRLKYANVTTNSIYLAFNDDAHVPWEFVLLVGIRWLVATVGLFFNSILIYVIMRSRSSLSGICNTLIGLNALFTVLFEFSLSIGFIIWLFGTHFLPLKTCFFIQAIPIICRNMIITTLFAIGFDRLISVTFTIWHRRQKYEIYLMAILVGCIVHAVYFLFTVIEITIKWPDLPVPCISSDDTYQGDDESVLFDINTTILCANVIVYMAIWILLVARKKTNLAYTHKVIKSLTWHAGTLTICWISYNALQALVFPMMFRRAEPWQNAYARFGVSILPYVAMAINSLTLYFFSKDYKMAYRQQFPFLCPIPSVAQQNGNAPNLPTVTRRIMITNSAFTTTTATKTTTRICPTIRMASSNQLTAQQPPIICVHPATPWDGSG